MSDTRIVVKGVPELIKKLGPQLIAQPLHDFFESASYAVQTRAQRNAPVDTGRLRTSITHEIDRGTPPLWAKIGTNVHYAPYMEYGTGIFAEGPEAKGGMHWPPGGALEPWAQRHGFESGWQVAYAIGRRGGLRPRRFLRNALKDSTGDIRRFLRDMGNQIQRRFGR